jgi:predicted ATPase
MGLDVPDNELTRDLDAKLRRQRALDLIVKLLRGYSQQKPLMLVVEDAHWADPASLEVINYVARNIVGYPLVLLLIHRPDEDLPDWTEYPHAVGLPLSSLDEGACLGIVMDMLGPVELGESLQELILSKSGGNPFFLMEVVRALVDAGALVQDDSGAWGASEDIERLELPDTIHGIIISRIDRLLESDRRVLQAASVVGRIFEFQLLSNVEIGADVEDVLRERLLYLASLGITEPHNIELEIHRFVHLTTREVVYESLSFRHRRDLHTKIGEVIEEIYAEELSEYTNLLAYHYFEGQTWDRALDYNLKSARRAQREYANDTAISSCQRALTAAAKLRTKRGISEQVLAAHEILGEVLTLVGRYAEALKHYGSSRNILQRRRITPERQAHLADLHRKTADVYERKSEYGTAFDWLDKALSYLDEEKPTIEITRIYLLGTGVYRRQGDIERAIQWCESSLNFASKIETREGKMAEAQAYYNLGGIYYRRGDLHRAADFCRQSVEVYQEIEHIVGQAKAYNNLGSAYKALGEWNLAKEAYHKSLAINRQIGEIFEQGMVTNNLGNIYLNQGELSRAEENFLESNAVWKRIGAVLPEAVTSSNLAQVYIYQGNWIDARGRLNQSQEIFNKVGSKDFVPELERRWGELYLGVGEFDNALKHILHSIETAQEQGVQLELGMSFHIFGEVHLARSEYGEAETALMRSLDILSELRSDYEAARTKLSIARLALKMGSSLDRDRLEEAIGTFEKLGAQADLEEALRLKEQI